MKYIIVVIMMICSTAHAGPATPECYYGLNGYPVGIPKGEVVDGIQHYAWFCGDRKHTTVSIQGFSCSPGHCAMSVFSEAVLAVTRASAKVGTADSYWGQYVTINCTEAQDDPLNDSLCKSRSAWIDSRMPQWYDEVKGWLGE